MSYVNIEHLQKFTPPAPQGAAPMVGVGAASSTPSYAGQVATWALGAAIVGGGVGALSSIYGHGRGLQGAGVGAVAMIGIGLLIGMARSAVGG